MLIMDYQYVKPKDYNYTTISYFVWV